MASGKIEATGSHRLPQESPAKGERTRSGESIFVGRVAHVRPESNRMDVTFWDGRNPQKDVYISYPYCGPMGMAQVMPEVDSVVVLMETGVPSAPFITLGYLPASPTKGPQYKMVTKWPKETSDPTTEPNRVVPLRHRILQPGDGILAASGGGEVFVDTDVELTDANGNAYRLRSEDGSSITTSQQNYMFCNGVWQGAGLIQRNSFDPMDGTKRKDGTLGYTIRHSNGRSSTYFGGEYRYGSELLTEYRIEMEDRATLRPPVNDVNSERNTQPRSPVVIFTMANCVGNNSSDSDTYGKFLAPDFFPSDDTGSPNPDFRVLSTVEEAQIKGVAWSFQTPDKSFIGSDKEGAFYQFIGQKRGDDAGQSYSLVSLGGKREYWGSDLNKGLSWDTFMTGGWRVHIGKSNENVSRGQLLGRSVHMSTEGQVYEEYATQGDPNQVATFSNAKKFMSTGKLRDYAHVSRVGGSQRLEVNGSREQIIEGAYNSKVGGGKYTKVRGSWGESSSGDRSIITNSIFSLNATQQTRIQTGSRDETIAMGDDKKLILKGNELKNLTVGSIMTSLQAGSVIELLMVGSKSTLLSAGSWTLTASVGMASISAAGGVNISSALVTSMSAGSLASIRGTAGVSISGPTVTIGSFAMAKGVLTSLNHPCFVTGAMSPGSFMVKAS